MFVIKQKEFSTVSNIEIPKRYRTKTILNLTI